MTTGLIMRHIQICITSQLPCYSQETSTLLMQCYHHSPPALAQASAG